MNRLIQSDLIEGRLKAGELTQEEADKLEDELWNSKPHGSILAKIIGLSSQELIYIFSMWVKFNKEERQKGEPDSNPFPFTIDEAWKGFLEVLYRGLNWFLWLQLLISSICLIREIRGQWNPGILEAINWVGNPLLAIVLIGLLKVTLGISVLFNRTDKT
jgi:hypothetical protein